MDMYMENNGFQVIDGTTPFEEDNQYQEADSLPVAPTQETVVEYGTGPYMEEADTLPAEQYQETAAEYGADTYIEEADALPVEPGQMEMPEPGLYQEAVPETEGIDMEQEEILPAVDDSEQTAELEADETGQSEDLETESAMAETAPADSGEDDEEKKRAEHEAAEAKRKAEWEEKQQAKKAAEQEELDQLVGMSDDDAVSAAMKRVGADTEKLTRRNMKDCVAEYIQTKCLEDSEFARLVMHPRKNMINCFRYINQRAKKFIEQEMEDNDTKPENGIYGSDVPDDLCYQWAEDYFRDPNVEEDEVKEEQFVSKSYVSSRSSKAKHKKTAKKKEPAKAQKAVKEPKAENTDNYAQISFMDTLMPGGQSVPEQKVG